MGYLHNRGDYRRYRGDPGILGTIGKIAGTAAGIVGAIVPGPAGTLVRSVGRVLKPTSTPVSAPISAAPAMPAVPRLAPMPVSTGSLTVNAAGQIVKKRRRMNVTNSKALRRAIRRQEGFVKLARKALKGTGYKISRAGTSTRRRVSVSEHGPGSVNIR